VKLVIHDTYRARDVQRRIDKLKGVVTDDVKEDEKKEEEEELPPAADCVQGVTEPEKTLAELEEELAGYLADEHVKVCLDMSKDYRGWPQFLHAFSVRWARHSNVFFTL